MFRKSLVILFLIVCTSALGAFAQEQDVAFKPKNIVSTMNRVFKWQIAHPVQENLKEDWARAVLYSGAMRAYEATKDKAYLKAAMRYADSMNFRPGKRFRHADDMTCGQSFLSIYRVKGKAYMLDGIKSRVDSLIADPKPGRVDWWWCDALFMEPPVLVELAQITGDKKYTDYLNKMWWDTADFLFDKEEHLFFRDKSFFTKTAANGRKLFWSRGNGWVLGGLVQVLETLPKTDSYYPQYVDLFQKMAAKIASLQQSDGLWRASLLDPEEVNVKETSGSGFYTFALAWGINNGYLSGEKYLPVVKRGWIALNEAVEPDGKLTYVQQIGAKPEKVKREDNQEYGTGAFLMAGTEMIKLVEK